MHQPINHFLLFWALVIYLFPYLVALFFAQRTYNLFRQKEGVGYLTNTLVKLIKTAANHE
jgi:hypothetical protein